MPRGLHTRLATANYWSGYGAGAVTCWMTLFGGDGEILAEWCERCAPASAHRPRQPRDPRPLCASANSAGQLFLHVVGAAGHDIVKYALDTFGEVPATADDRRCPRPTTPTPGRPIAMPACRLPPRRAGRALGPEQPPDRDPGRRRRPQPDGRRAVSRRSSSRSLRSPAARSMSPSCCPISPGRARSSCAPASTWCGRATRWSSAAGAGSRTSTSSAAI